MEAVGYTDQELLRQIAGGSERAFGVLYDRYRDKVFAIAFKLTHSEHSARDVMQEIFMKLWQGHESLPEIEHLSAYINTLTRNYTYNTLRRLAHEELLMAELLKRSAGTSNPENDFLLKELKDSLHEAIILLPPRQKKVFELSRLEGLKHEEIAERLQISRETVKKHIMEAMRNIKTILAHKGHLTLLLLFFAR